MIGSSLGGLISCYAGWTQPQVFGETGCMSSSFWWNNMDFNTSILVKFPPPSEKKLFYIDTGTDEGSDPALQVQQTQTVASHIEDLGWTFNQNIFTYFQQGGQHNEYYWGKRFPHVLSTMFPVQTEKAK
jgi:pullulanase